MYEVELKIPAVHGPVRDRLRAIGARHLGSVDQVDTYYDAPHREFAETDEALRVRRETVDGNVGAKVAYKGPLVERESKSREEVETGVDDGEDLAAILENLGFTPAATVHKERDRFAVDGHTVTLDAVEGLGEFVEVETDVETEAEVEGAREDATELLRRLDLDPDDGIRTSYLGLLLERNGPSPDARE